MANTPRRQRPERFGSYNNISPNNYSNSEKVLDVRTGILEPFYQMVQSTLQNSYGTDTLSSFGNVFRAKVLGVIAGRPARHLYPGLYANSAKMPEEMPEYFIFSLRDESDQFAPDPSNYANSPEQHVDMMGLQGNAISEKPVSETIESFGRGDIVEVYKPEQNSWNGAVVRKVVVRNNFSEGVVRGSGAAAAHNTAANGPFRSSTSGGSFTPRLVTTSSTGRLGTQADWDVFSPGVVYPPGSIQLVELFTEAAKKAGYPEEWGRLPGLVGASRDISDGGLVLRESAGVVGRLNYTWRNSSDTSVFDLPVKRPDPNMRPSWEEKQPQNIEYAIRWIQDSPRGYKNDDIEEGVRLPAGINSSATGLGQLLSSIGYANMPLNYGGYGIPMEEAIGMLKYIEGRYGHPTAGYSFHNFPKLTGDRVYYIGNAGEHHSEAVRVEKRDGDYYRTDTGAEVSRRDFREIGFTLDEAHNRVRYSGFFKRQSASGLIITSGVDEFGRREVKAHEGY